LRHFDSQVVDEKPHNDTDEAGGDQRVARIFRVASAECGKNGGKRFFEQSHFARPVGLERAEEVKQMPDVRMRRKTPKVRCREGAQPCARSHSRVVIFMGHAGEKDRKNSGDSIRGKWGTRSGCRVRKSLADKATALFQGRFGQSGKF
jgi:hypothetical protein